MARDQDGSSKSGGAVSRGDVRPSSDLAVVVDQAKSLSAGAVAFTEEATHR